ncbi:MAG TPA: MmcQ/YjbR family DNA-binding protein [Steroidobacteraceae bacterium]|nr:MmcQ/YjbR family DNA-binding protein [Steroidobacteraceae bacterium]
MKVSPRGAVTRSAGAPYDRFLKIALKLPGTEESVSYGTPSVKVKGKILSRLRTEAEGALALVCDFVDREMLLQADPNAFFLTDHYRNYPMILIRLDKIRADALPDLVERAWRMRAPAKLIKEFDAHRSKASD